jgi:1-acyl-sn-glycerol-3-phosphate acyltransferase
LVARDLGGRASRIAAQTPDVVFAAWVATVLLIALPALWLLLLLTPGGRPADRLVKLACRILLRACGLPLRVAGADALAGLGPVVLCANHQSYLDSVALLAALPVEVCFVAKRELLEAPLVGTIIRKVGHLPVDRVDLSRSVADAESVTATLRSGASLLVFPEGTFRAAPGLLPFRLGGFKAAVEAGRPVVPVAIVGTRHILRGDDRLPRRGPISVTIGEPIRPAAQGGWPEMVRVRDAARAMIARATGEPLVESRRA